MSLHVLDNAFLLDLALETPKGALNGFSVVNLDFCQNVSSLKPAIGAVSMSACYAKKQCVFFQMPVD